MPHKKTRVEQREEQAQSERACDVVTTDDVLSIEERRAQERRQIGVRIDAISKQMDNDAVRVGCAAGMCGVFGLVQRMGARRRTGCQDAHFIAHEMERSDARPQRDTSLSFFGNKRGKTKQQRAVDRLQEASIALTSRVESLDEKALQFKSDAAKMAKAGDKPKALRMLKKSKQAAAHAASLQQAADAVERQTNIMEDVSLQTQIAGALEATMGPMKTSKKALASVEKVADEASEIRDVNEEIQSALSQLNDGSSLAIDDDELEAELDGMLEHEVCSQSTHETQPRHQTYQSQTDEQTAQYSNYPRAPSTTVQGGANTRQTHLSAC